MKTIILVIFALFFDCCFLLPPKAVLNNGYDGPLPIIAKLIDDLSQRANSLSPVNTFSLRNVPTKISEGGFQTIYIRLSLKTSETQTVIIASDNPAIEVGNASSTTLTFAPTYSTIEQSFTLNALIDNNQIDETAQITISSSSIETTTLSIKNTDTLGSWISIPNGNVVEGSTGNFNVKLTQKPFENIAVTLSSSLTELSIDTPLITFTSDNWNTNQTIGLTGSIDSNSISETVTITGNATGISNTGTVQYLENGIIIAGANSIKANNTAIILVSLERQPKQNVSVSLKSNTGEVTVSSSNLLFTAQNYNTAQTITLSSGSLTNTKATITASSNGISDKTTSIWSSIPVAYSWGTFTDNFNGTIQFDGIAGTFGGNIYTAKTLTFMKCTQGQTYDSTNNTCIGSPITYQFCSTVSNNCNNGDLNQILGSAFLNNAYSSAYNTCDDLIFAGKTDWRVPTISELKTLIHCTDKTMPSVMYMGCSLGNFSSPAVNGLFPNTVAYNYWSSATYATLDQNALTVYFSDGSLSNSPKNTDTYHYIRCISGQ